MKPLGVFLILTNAKQVHKLLSFFLQVSVYKITCMVFAVAYLNLLKSIYMLY